jgi:hypothetical protein
MSAQKNFVVSFRNDGGNINAIMEGGYGKHITDIIIAINSSSDFEEAKKNKIPCIQDYIYKNMNQIDFLIYLYGQSLVISQYINRFGPITDSPILEVDFATLIMDNIIMIHEALQFPVNNTFTRSVSSQTSFADSPIPQLTPNSSRSFDESEELNSTQQLICQHVNELTDEDIMKFLS